MSKEVVNKILKQGEIWITDFNRKRERGFENRFEGLCELYLPVKTCREHSSPKSEIR